MDEQLSWAGYVVVCVENAGDVMWLQYLFLVPALPRVQQEAGVDLTKGRERNVREGKCDTDMKYRRENR